MSPTIATYPRISMCLAGIIVQHKLIVATRACDVSTVYSVKSGSLTGCVAILLNYIHIQYIMASASIKRKVISIGGKGVFNATTESGYCLHNLEKQG